MTLLCLLVRYFQGFAIVFCSQSSNWKKTFQELLASDINLCLNVFCRTIFKRSCQYSSSFIAQPFGPRAFSVLFALFPVIEWENRLLVWVWDRFHFDLSSIDVCVEKIARLKQLKLILGLSGRNVMGMSGASMSSAASTFPIIKETASFASDMS